MRLHRFYIPEFSGKEGAEIFIKPDSEKNEALIHQWRDVFRLKTGSMVTVFNSDEGEWQAKITSLDKKSGASLEVIELGASAELLTPMTEMALYMAIIKNSNFDLVVEKATEQGVSHIIPVTTERTVKTSLNFERLNKLAIEAAEQSGRISPPKIYDIMDLAESIEHAKNFGGKAFFGHIAQIEPYTAPYKIMPKAALFIGPEGGWTEEEIELLKNNSVQPICFGEFTLRAETAAIAGLSKLTQV